MPRYIVQRTFKDGLCIPVNEQGAAVVGGVVAINASEGVTWIHSYVTEDLRRTFCVYDGPTPEAIRSVASRNNMTVDHVVPVTVLDPYFYRS